MEHLLLIAPAVIILLLLIILLYQRRQLHIGHENNVRIRSEKEAVIELMDNMGERMTRGIDLNETLQVIADYVVKATQAESCAIFLLDESDHTLQARVVVGLFPPLFEDEEIKASRNKYLAEKIRSKKLKLNEGVVGSALSADKPILISDPEADPRIPRAACVLTPVHSLMLSPLRVRGRQLGVLVVANKEGHGVFDPRDMLLLEALADQAAVTVDLVKLYDVLAQQQRLEQELQVAREFQRMLLPRAVPKIEGYEFSAINESALMVGGDFYDFFMIDRNHLGVVIADVSGKGIPGALIMAVVRSVLRAEARDTTSPKEALRRVNERLLTDTKDNVFVTITYAILDIPNQRLRFVRAGHEPILVRHQPESTGEDAALLAPRINQFLPEGMAVGLMPGDIFSSTEELEIQLTPGDVVLLYTDGAIEAVDVESREYGRPKLVEMLLREGGRSAEELVAELTRDIKRFSSGIPQHDDITLVALRVMPEAGSETAPATGEIHESISTQS